MTDLHLLGRTLDRFEILEELGRGGMAVVYKARQLAPNRLVALKVLPPELSYDKSYIARFHQEADSAAALEHPHIVPIYSVAEAEGFHYIAMKYINGRTLKERIQEQGSMALADAAVILDQVADALDYAHSQGVIHRDIKPSNMMLDQNGWVYLTDFGLARGSANAGLTQAGTVMGTPEYMSPEQAQGLATIGPPTDIYALGVVLYEMLTGQMPFHADTPMGMLVARLQYAPRPPSAYRGDLPAAVEDVVMRALARKPEARFPSARDLVAALKSAAGLGSRSIVQPQRPVSPPLGVPAQSLPASPHAGVQRPTSQPPLPPTQASSGTPPYVIPAVGPTVAINAPRDAAPVAPTVMSGLPAAPPDTAPASTPAAKPRSKVGLFAGIGVVAVLLIAAAVGGAAVLGGNNQREQIQRGLDAGAASLATKGGVDQAIADYKAVLAIDANNAAAHSQLALIYNLRSRYTDAEDAARAAIKADDDSAFGYAMLAEALNNQGDRDGAMEAADKAVDLDDDLSAGYGARSGILADQAVEEASPDLLGDAADDAQKAIDEAADEDNLAKALAHSARGYVYWQEYTATNDSSKVSRGVEEFNQAIGLQPQIAVFHSNLGYFYDNQGEHDRAVEKFEAALDADPDYAHAHAGLGWNLYYLENYDGALGEFDEAINRDPLDTDAYIGKSYVFQAMDPADYGGAITALNDAAGVAPERPSIFAELGWAYRAQGIAQEYGSDEQRQSYTEAEAQFRKALELNDRFVDAYTGLGWALQDQAGLDSDTAKFQASVEELQRSLELKEDQPYAHNALGWSYYNLSQYEDAIASFSRATELKADYADAFYGLGSAHEQQGDTDAAREAYQTASDLGSSGAADSLASLE